MRSCSLNLHLVLRAFLLVVRGTVNAVVRAKSAGRMLILRRIIEQTRPAEKQQRCNQMKTGSHLSRLCYTKMLCQL